MTTSRRRTQRRSEMMPDPDPIEQEEVSANSGMPEPPPNWPPPIIIGTNSTLDHTSLRNNQQGHGEQLAGPSSGSDESTRSRGPTLMHSGWGKDEGILQISINKLGQPIINSASKLASNLGVLARNGILAPLNYVDWRIVPSHIKDDIWSHIKENTNATDGMLDYIMQSFAKKWKEWKATAKAQGFTPYKTTQERLLHRPQRVEENQWRRLVHYWEGEKAKRKSEKNKASRALLTMPHIAGRKSLPQVREEMTIKNNGVEPTRREVFKETHFKNGKATSEASAQAIKDMDNLHAQNPESSQTGFVRDDIYGQVLGSELHGRVRTLGLGPTPSTIFGASYRQLQTERRDTEVRHQQELERIRVQMEAENERMKANMEAEIQKVREEMNLHMQQNEQTRTEIEVMK